MELTLTSQTAHPRLQKAGDHLPFDYEVVPGRGAITRYFELRKKRNRVPLILGNTRDMQLLLENSYSRAHDFVQTKALAQALNLTMWFDQQAATDRDYYRAPRGSWPNHNFDKLDFSIHQDILAGNPKYQVVIGQLPLKQAWQACGFLNYGGWARCPAPEVHMALFCHWQAQYGAQVAAMTGDIIEVSVANPPKTPQQAMILAHEQFIYCPDIVHQGVGTLENLAASLLNSPVWYFWWDMSRADDLL
ncbi:hypothetical protein VST7929_02792 [Vibrio stylophorae]|uniref:DUF4253 domain-containing protein n=1 Tax=Vibrio stylophorae TaxID=659351 RepID=A0ABN8DVJ3_9VIBR|nr:DUF4253 domain-containing protein [Vibrio stylophorae]CAH0535131.1 hypothetical protein VST7929_02792 [Vibrio stylophorae]